MLFLSDSIRASITNLNSGMKDMTLSNLANLRRRSTITDVPAVGIKDEVTIIESNMFQPSLKKSVLFFQQKNELRFQLQKIL